MSHPVPVILSPGTHIGTCNDANRIGPTSGTLHPNGASGRIPAGAVGEFKADEAVGLRLRD